MPTASYEDQPLFVGVTFWGSEFLPGDIVPRLENIRRWAFDNGLIMEPDLQLLTPDEVDILRQHFDLQDKLTICVFLYKDAEGSLCYFEHPHLPIGSLIRRGTEVQLVYWTMRPGIRTPDGEIVAYGEVRLGFWYPGTSPLEFCSESTAKLVVPKFNELYHKLSDQYPSAVVGDGSLDITIDGELSARFFKSGRLFDVELT
ncbi:MAG TPA: hypothetical protein VMW58_00325 [Anaerolineae bacterium]|nr:hypothetical protein [Anaerolineae bacterium]